MISIDILSAIKDRRSIHNFKNDEVERVIIQEIFTYASYAPTHYMKESWQIKLYEKNGKKHFIDAIIESYQRLGMLKTRDDDKTEKMIHSMKQFLLRIPHHALIYFKKEDDPVRYEEEYASVCAFIQNAQLTAWSYGVGMLWTITPYMHDEGFTRAIGLDPSIDKIAAVLQIGYPEKIPHDKGRTPIGEKLEFLSE
ncbi:Nitroreductase [Lentibacillus persicus]|uniref:Nitroreductase n=1 Tax=Lentibacillus persicus TaxID=640948 RepID=A0A1I1WL77_9BACI|nr:nitroreductase [Lentibacillus persicus]SFD95731.1 Nitroreductase [Lentibacillus persicus]